EALLAEDMAPPPAPPPPAAAPPPAQRAAAAAAPPPPVPAAPPRKPAPPPELVVELQGEEVLRIPLTDKSLVIGREKSVDVPLDDRALSRRHASVEKRGAAIWVSDLGSANGTYVNGEKIEEPRPLSEGDVIGLGHYRLHIDGAQAAGGQTPILTLTGPEGTHRFALVGEQIIVGRSQACDISIGHKSMSRRHVRIARDGDGFLVEDLGSQNGCHLNGERLTGSAPLRPGDRIDICDFALTLGFAEDEDGAATEGEPSLVRRPSTMLIDKRGDAKAAYVDGDFDKVRAAAPEPDGAASTVRPAASPRGGIKPRRR
ncbi:MAG: FHA domain-containing protein, partial [Myxococcota bacterium]